MSNFTVISIVVTCLFVSTVLIVDHIEVARTNRIVAKDIFKKMEWTNTQTFDAYIKELGIQDRPIEELAAAHKDWERITKILKTTK